MITVFYTHVDRISTEYSKEFEEPEEALKFYLKMKNLRDKRNGRKLYIVSYISTQYNEMMIMERIWK